MGGGPGVPRPMDRCHKERGRELRSLRRCQHLSRQKPDAAPRVTCALRQPPHFPHLGRRLLFSRFRFPCPGHRPLSAVPSEGTRV